jgi:type I restriction enzyme, S subunit
MKEMAMNNKTMILLDKHFDAAFAAPDGIKKLRELILTLAMQGKLVPQDPNDEPASELLKSIEAEKQRLMKSGTIKQAKSLPKIEPKEVPYDLPKSWEWVRLGGISEYIQRGKSPSYSDIRVIPIISQKCIQWSGFDKKVVKFIDPSTLDKYQDERFIRTGDLLWNSTGTGTLGRINIYNDELKDFEKVVADSHVTVVRPTEVCNEYVLNFLMSPIVQNHVEENASGTTNQIELNTTTVTIQLISLPPLAEQHRIVAEIDRLMARCDELEKLRADRSQKLLTVHTAALDNLLKAKESSDFSTAWHFIAQNFSELYSVKENVAQLRKAILQLAVMGKLVPQDPNDEPASELLKAIELEKQRLVKEGKIKQSKPLLEIQLEEMPSEVPKGWQWVRLGELALFSDSGWSPQCLSESRSGQEWGVLKVSAVSWGEFRPEENKALPQGMEAKPECEVQVGDFLISRANTEELVARSVVVKTAPVHLMMSDKIVRFNLSQKIEKDFINFANLSRFAREYYARNASGTSSSMKNISREVINNLPILLPPIAEQHRIVAEIDRLMALCDRLEESIEAAKSKQTDLLNALMSQV